MKLSRALGKFATSAVTRWNSSTKQWVDTGCTGSLLVFDRFVTERTFGQKKRILIVPFEHRLDMAKATILRVGDAFETFLLEKENSDVRFGNVYGYTYLLQEAPYRCTVRKATLSTTNAAGIKVKNGVTDLFSTWIDIDRYAAAPSKKFEETEFSLLTLTFAKGLTLDTDMYVDVDAAAGGGRYSIDEVYSTLSFTSAKGKRIGA